MDERASARFVAEDHRQLTAEGAKTYFTHMAQPYVMCQRQFSKISWVSQFL